MSNQTSKCLLTGLALLAVSCEKPASHALQLEIRRITDDSFMVIPAKHQLPYCLLFTTSEKGVVRQLTMTHENKSVPCPAGQPIGGVRYRVLPDEGPLTVQVFFSNKKLNAGSVAQQIYEQTKEKRSLDPINLRLPGQVSLVQLTFNPQGETEATTGGVVGAGGTLDAGVADAG